jgi:hypothetical protein
MRFHVKGPVVDVEHREYVNGAGEVVRTFDAWIGSDNPKYGADRISGPGEAAPMMGDYVDLVVNVTAKEGKRGPYLAVWVIADASLAVHAA